MTWPWPNNREARRPSSAKLPSDLNVRADSIDPDVHDDTHLRTGFAVRRQPGRGARYRHRIVLSTKRSDVQISLAVGSHVIVS